MEILEGVTLSEVLTMRGMLNLVIAILTTAFAVSIGLYARARVSRLSKTWQSAAKEKTIHQKVKLYLMPMLAPTLTAVFLSTIYAAGEWLKVDMELFPLFIQLAILWFFLSLVYIITRSRGKTKISALIVVPLVVLNFFGILDDTITALDGIAFEMGTLKISVYKVIKFGFAATLLIWIASALSDFFTDNVRKHSHLDTNSRIFLTAIAKAVIYFIVLMVALNMIGIDVTTLAVLSGGIGVGIGFGLQKIASNFISGVILLFEKTVKENDMIEIGTDIKGFVRETGPRYTLIETLDSRDIMVPNEDFITQRVTNWTMQSKSGRIDIAVGVAYGSNLHRVREILLEAVQACDIAMENPGPICHVHAFASNSVEFMLYFWIPDVSAGRGGPRTAVMLRIWELFEENKIAIPFPQREIRILNTKAEDALFMHAETSAVTPGDTHAEKENDVKRGSDLENPK